MRAATLSLSADSADGQTKRQPWHDITVRNILSGAIGVDFRGVQGIYLAKCLKHVHVHHKLMQKRLKIGA